MTHTEAHDIVKAALSRLLGRTPSEAEIAGAQAVGWLETHYGRWSQFASLAAAGHFNWGAHETSRSGDGTCRAGTVPGSDVGGVCFYVFDNDDEAAEDYIKILTKNGVPLDQGAYAQASAMQRAGYYQGFHWAPGYNEAVGQQRPDAAIEMDSPEAARQANVADYASAISSAQAAFARNPSADFGPPPVRGSVGGFFYRLSPLAHPFLFGGALLAAAGGAALAMSAGWLSTPALLRPVIRHVPDPSPALSALKRRLPRVPALRSMHLPRLTW